MTRVNALLLLAVMTVDYPLNQLKYWMQALMNGTQVLNCHCLFGGPK